MAFNTKTHQLQFYPEVQQANSSDFILIHTRETQGRAATKKITISDILHTVPGPTDDDQLLFFNPITNQLTIQDGNTVDLSSLFNSNVPNGVNSGDILSWDVFGNTWQVNGNVQIEATGVIEYSTSARINLRKNWLHNSWTTLGNHQVEGDVIAQADIVASSLPSYATGAEPPSREEVRIDTITGQLYRTPINSATAEKGNTAHIFNGDFIGGVSNMSTPLMLAAFTSATYVDPTGNIVLNLEFGEISNTTGADIRVKLDFSFLAGSGTISRTELQVTDGATTQDLGYFVPNGMNMISMQTVVEIPAFGKLIILIQNGDPFPSDYEFTGTFTVEQLSI